MNIPIRNESIFENIERKIEEHNNKFVKFPMLVISENYFGYLIKWLHKNNIDYIDWKTKHQLRIELTQRKEIIELY